MMHFHVSLFSFLISPAKVNSFLHNEICIGKGNDFFLKLSFCPGTKKDAKRIHTAKKKIWKKKTSSYIVVAQNKGNEKTNTKKVKNLLYHIVSHL